MRRGPGPIEVRDIVARTFDDYGAYFEDLADLDETILIDDGRYVARSYRVEGYMAMWLVGVGIVQFYDAEGNMLRTVNLFEELLPQRVAA